MMSYANVFELNHKNPTTHTVRALAILPPPLVFSDIFKGALCNVQTFFCPLFK